MTSPRPSSASATWSMSPGRARRSAKSAGSPTPTPSRRSSWARRASTTSPSTKHCCRPSAPRSPAPADLRARIPGRPKDTNGPRPCSTGHGRGSPSRPVGRIAECLARGMRLSATAAGDSHCAGGSSRSRRGSRPRLDPARAETRQSARPPIPKIPWAAIGVPGARVSSASPASPRRWTGSDGSRGSSTDRPVTAEA